MRKVNRAIEHLLPPPKKKKIKSSLYNMWNLLHRESEREKCVKCVKNVTS